MTSLTISRCKTSSHVILGFERIIDPQPGGWGYIVFGADPVGVGVSFFISVHYLLNQLLDFNQTCLGTLFGGGKC